MSAALWLALPGASLEDRLARSPADPLTLAYLRAWLSASSQDVALHLVLARKHAALGDVEAALAALEPALAHGDPSVVDAARLLRAELLETRAFAAAAGSRARETRLAEAREELRALASRAGDDDATLEALQLRALAAGDPALARELLARRAALTGGSIATAHPRLAALADAAEALGDAAGAAALHWRAFDVAPDEASRRRAFFAAIRLLRSQDRGADALAQADARLDRLSPDVALMRFMVRLAQAAGRADLADRYAREMLRFSLLDAWRALAVAPPTVDRGALVRVGFVRVQSPASAPGEPAAPAPRAPEPRLAFDDATYRLAYDVFLANRNLADAYAVAASAVRQSPSSLDWRRRLAQVAEWTGRGPVALAERLALARAGGAADDWAQVERLAGQLADVDALLEALQARAAAAPDEALDLRIAQLHEDRGDPRAAVRWLTARIDARGDVRSARLIERQVALHDALGDTAGMLAWLDRADAAHGASVERAMRRASTRLARGDVAGAFDALRAVREAASAGPRAGGSDGGYWRRYAELAARLQRDDDVDLGHRTLVRLGLATPADLADWSVRLAPRSARAAARVAEHAWRTAPTTDAAERAFDAWLQAGDLDAVDRLAAALPPALRDALLDRPEHLIARATHLQARGDDAGARRALERALLVRPDDAEVRAGLTWLLIAQREAPALRDALVRWDAAARREPALWGPFAAAWMALDEPTRALPWFERRARAGGGDPLWRLARADALERSGRADAAWGERRRAWLDVRREAAPAGADPWREQAAVALALRFASADGSARLLRALSAARESAWASARAAAGDGGRAGVEADAAAPRGAGDRAASGGPDGDAARRGPAAADVTTLLAAIDADLALAARLPDVDAAPDAANRPDTRALVAGSRELVLSSMLTREADDAARGWLLSRYADGLARPAWARLSIALADRDRESLAALLDALPDWLPQLDAIDAMRAAGRDGDARALAARVLDARPAVDDAHARLVDATLPDASSVQLEASDARIGPLAVRGLRATARRALSDAASVGLVLDREHLRSLDDGQLVLDPARDVDRVALGLRWRADRHTGELEVSRLQGFADRSGLRLVLRPRPDAEIGPTLTLGLSQPAFESAPLRAAGVRDLAELRWGVGPTARDRWSASAAAVRLRSQDGTALASGTVLSLQAVHRLRIDYPDLALRALLLRADWTPTGALDSVVAPRVPAAFGDPVPSIVPVSSTEVAFGIAFGDSVSQSYSRAVRPFGEALVRANSVSGAGYALRAGLTASVFGTDRLSVFASLLSATPGIPRASRTVGIAYQHPF